MKKIILIFLLLFPIITFAQGDTIFKAKVKEIIKEQESVLPDGAKAFQQDLKLIGLEGEHKNKEVIFYGINDYAEIRGNVYEIGDKVMMVENIDDQGNAFYYITDYVRTGSIWLLVIAFIFCALAVGRFKGLMSLVSLFLSFLVIIKYIIPKILAGGNPLIATLIGSVFILLIVIYLTEGFNRKSHIAVGSIFICLAITVFLSQFFVSLAKLSGVFSEEVSFLISVGGGTINFKGLLLAGIIIGALGVLDDVVISQISTVEELRQANPQLTKKEIFQKAYRVGVSHISSMTNTLFLAYAGAALPILIIFGSDQSAYSSFSQIINEESIATEIVRTLAGSIGLILSVPIATWMAAGWITRRGNT